MKNLSPETLAEIKTETSNMSDMLMNLISTHFAKKSGPVASLSTSIRTMIISTTKDVHSRFCILRKNYFGDMQKVPNEVFSMAANAEVMLQRFIALFETPTTSLTQAGAALLDVCANITHIAVFARRTWEEVTGRKMTKKAKAPEAMVSPAEIARRLMTGGKHQLGTEPESVRGRSMEVSLPEISSPSEKGSRGPCGPCCS